MLVVPFPHLRGLTLRFTTLSPPWGWVFCLSPSVFRTLLFHGDAEADKMERRILAMKGHRSGGRRPQVWTAVGGERELEV